MLVQNITLKRVSLDMGKPEYEMLQEIPAPEKQAILTLRNPVL